MMPEADSMMQQLLAMMSMVLYMFVVNLIALNMLAAILSETSVALPLLPPAALRRSAASASAAPLTTQRALRALSVQCVGCQRSRGAAIATSHILQARTLT